MAGQLISDLTPNSPDGTSYFEHERGGVSYKTHINWLADYVWNREIKELTDTLTAGNTSLMISDSSIEASSWVDVFAGGVLYETMTVSAGSVTLTFPEQISDLTVRVRIS